MLLRILALLKLIIPKNKVGAWILGIIAAGLAIFMGVQNGDLKDEFCKGALVEIPKLPDPELQKLEKADVKAEVKPAK